MREIKRIKVSEIQPDPNQPRKHFDEADLLALGQNMKQRGQALPIIVHRDGGVYRLIEGERRVRSAPVVGITELDGIVLDHKPTELELALLQASIDFHRVSLSTMERSDQLARIREQTHMTVGEIAEEISVGQPTVSKLLACQRGVAEVRDALNKGLIDLEKAVVICQQPPDKQRELLKDAATCSREQLRQRVKSNGTEARKAPQAKFALPSGVEVSIRGQELTLSKVIEAMLATVKALKKGQSDGYDIVTQQRVMRDRARKQED